MSYSPEFQDWWKSLRRPGDATAKRWAWRGWEARKADDERAEREYREQFKRSLDEAVARGEDIHSPGFWGDFS